MNDEEILDRIHRLIEDEHDLRQQASAGAIPLDAEHQRVADLERALDQCWDLLRQRRARREMGQNADEATARDTDEVEHYLQ